MKLKAQIKLITFVRCVCVCEVCVTASVSECFHISKFECVNLLCHFHLGVCACVLGNANHTKHSLGNNKEKLFQDECS